MKTPWGGLPDVGVQGPHAADEHRHLRSGQRQEVGPLHQQGLRRQLLSGSEVVAEAVVGRFEHGERLHVGLLQRGVRAPRHERDRDVVPGVLRRLLDGRAPAQDDQVGERDLLPAGLRAVEVLLDVLEGLQHVGQLGRVVDLPVPLRRKAYPCPVGSAPLVGAAEAGRRRPGGGGKLGDGKSRGEDPALEGSDVLVADQLMIDRGDGVLPDLRLRNPRAEITDAATTGPLTGPAASRCGWQGQCKSSSAVRNSGALLVPFSGGRTARGGEANAAGARAPLCRALRAPERPPSRR